MKKAPGDFAMTRIFVIFMVQEVIIGQLSSNALSGQTIGK